MQRPCPTLKLFLVFALVTPLGSKTLRGQTADQQTYLVKLLHSGSEAMRSGNSAAAESIFQQVITAAPTLSDGYLGLGLTQLQEGKTDEGKSSTEAGNRAESKTSRAPHMFLGVAQYRMGQLDLASVSLSEEVALRPDNTEALTWLGIVEIEAGHPERANGSPSITQPH